MSVTPQTAPQPAGDSVSNVLKWILLAAAIVSFALFFLATARTYQKAPPQPDRFVTSGGAVVMTNEDTLTWPPFRA